jgi:hypothetical protein
MLPIAAALFAIGCTPAQNQPRESVVFAMATGFGQGLRRATPVDTVDIGVPELHNLTARSVRVRKISLVAVPRTVRLLNVTAHPGQPVGIVRGDLVKLCRTTYPSYPVTDAITAPYGDSNWFLVLAIQFAKPGRYELRRVKIFYTTGGRQGWQYQNFFTTIYVQAAQPSTKPHFDGCP